MSSVDDGVESVTIRPGALKFVPVTLTEVPAAPFTNDQSRFTEVEPSEAIAIARTVPEFRGETNSVPVLEPFVGKVNALVVCTTA